MILNEELPQSLAGLMSHARRGFLHYARAQAAAYEGDVRRALRAIDNATRYSEELRSMRPNALYTPERIVKIGEAQKYKIRDEFFNLTMIDDLVQDFRLHKQLSKDVQAARKRVNADVDEFRNRLLAHMFRPTARNRESLHKFVQILYKARRKSRKAGDLANVYDIDRKIAVYTAIARECMQVIRIAVGSVQFDAALYTAEGKSKSSYNLVIHNHLGSVATTGREKAKVKVGLARKPKPLAEDFGTWAELKKETTEKTGRAINRLPLKVASASTCRK